MGPAELAGIRTATGAGAGGGALRGREEEEAVADSPSSPVLNTALDPDLAPPDAKRQAPHRRKPSSPSSTPPPHLPSQLSSAQLDTGLLLMFIALRCVLALPRST